MIKVHDRSINELELIVVLDWLQKRGNVCADIYQGNGCIWVASGSANYPINEYFIFRDGRLAEIQID